MSLTRGAVREVLIRRQVNRCSCSTYTCVYFLELKRLKVSHLECDVHLDLIISRKRTLASNFHMSQIMPDVCHNIEILNIIRQNSRKLNLYYSVRKQLFEINLKNK